MPAKIANAPMNSSGSNTFVFNEWGLMDLQASPPPFKRHGCRNMEIVRVGPKAVEVAEKLEIDSPIYTEIYKEISTLTSESQWHRQVLAYRFSDLEYAFSVAKWTQGLRRIKRRDALRIYSYLTHPSVDTYEEREMYALSGYWMIAREYDLSYMLRYLELTAKPWKKLADAQEQRYRLCRGLIEYGAVDSSVTPAAMWILCEYQRSIYNRQNRETIGTKQKAYKAIKEAFDTAINHVQEGQPLKPLSKSEAMEYSIASLLLGTAVDLAQESKDFDRTYFTPYVKAEKSLNKRFLDKKYTIARIPPPRGPRIGAKRNKR